MRRYAVVTGANKGIGYGICKKLASSGVMVALTARNEKRGLDAVESLKELGLSDFVVFHQLDVTDSTSVLSLAEFIKIQFGKLDILVNNAGVPGGIVNGENVLKTKLVVGKVYPDGRIDKISSSSLSFSQGNFVLHLCGKKFSAFKPLNRKITAWILTYKYN
ncbi:hypothetical protein TSUD_100810 [Trifolium subterraneum]|uniref:(+)-neomenthol dehydrogenase n=1 Tax=Trifolium subterraneum TaxID=3900 RepID=A0A2Z6PCS9_TRISU|nr:hypothetical protein TSUD_100810 [Trifolium subterraneum]